MIDTVSVRGWTTAQVSGLSALGAEQAGTLLRGLGQPAGAPTGVPSLSRDELNECLRSGRVRARFEPKIDLQSGRPVACEAISYVAHARHCRIRKGFTRTRRSPSPPPP